tara:strand:- start:1534 stop:2166 length:633 start_codon:yes stop_codon:yes gene_type:complete
MKFITSLTLLISLVNLGPVLGQTPDAGPMEPVPPAPGQAPDETVAEQIDRSEEIEFIQRSNFVLAKIRTNSRQVDPFGLFMDPTNTSDSRNLADQYSDIEETPVLNQSSLKSALGTLPISGIYPERKVVVLGARSLTPGGQFGMKLEELTIRLRFEGIKGKSVFFKDMDTQEVASVEFNPLPAEFEPISDTSTHSLGQGIVPMSELFIVN